MKDPLGTCLWIVSCPFSHSRTQFPWLPMDCVRVSERGEVEALRRAIQSAKELKPFDRLWKQAAQGLEEFVCEELLLTDHCGLLLSLHSMRSQNLFWPRGLCSFPFGITVVLAETLSLARRRSTWTPGSWIRSWIIASLYMERQSALKVFPRLVRRRIVCSGLCWSVLEVALHVVFCRALPHPAGLSEFCSNFGGSCMPSRSKLQAKQEATVCAKFFLLTFQSLNVSWHPNLHPPLKSKLWSVS